MSTKVLKSKALAWAAFVLVIIAICVSFPFRKVWWSFSDIFCVFMMVFCHLISVNIAKYNVFASRKLELIALVFGVLTVAALIVETILFQMDFA